MTVTDEFLDARHRSRDGDSSLLGRGSVLRPRGGDVRQSINRIKASPYVPHTDAVRGFIFEVENGGLREVNLA